MRSMSKKTIRPTDAQRVKEEEEITKFVRVTKFESLERI